MAPVGEKHAYKPPGLQTEREIYIDGEVTEIKNTGEFVLEGRMPWKVIKG